MDGIRDRNYTGGTREETSPYGDQPGMDSGRKASANTEKCQLTPGSANKRRQIREKEGCQLKIGFIGAGKVGCSLGKYFAETAGFYSRSSESAREAARFTDTVCYESIRDLIEECDVIFLTVPDGSIRETWDQVKRYEIKNKIICHCSGALSAADAFPGIEETGANGYSAHPLFAVSDKYNAYKELSGVFFTLESAQSAEDAKGTAAAVPGLVEDAKDAAHARGADVWDPGLAVLQGLLESKGNPTRIIAAADKTLYHCAAAVASNLVCGLIDQSVTMMKRCGFAEEDAVKALAPILTGNMAHIASKGPTASLTGPVERNDVDTVRKHLECLTDDRERQLYSLLSSRVIEMAQHRHPDRDYSDMRRLMEQDGQARI